MARLDGVFYEEIVEQSLREFPDEACGLIAADDGAPAKVFPITNIRHSPDTYEFEPTEQLRVTDEIEGAGWGVWGIYHSHTHTEAYPSRTDRERSKTVVEFYPDVRFLILSLEDRDRPVFRSFFIREGDVEEEELTIG